MRVNEVVNKTRKKSHHCRLAMKLTLQTPTGSQYFLEVGSQRKGREVKVKIFQELEIKNKVALLWKGKELEDHITLRSQGITEDTTIGVVPKPDVKLKLIIQTFKKGKISGDLPDTFTVNDLKESLATSTIAMTALISDFYFGDVKLSDQMLPFHLYGITDGSVITQRYQGSFNINLVDSLSFHRHSFNVKGTDTIAELKENVIVFMKLIMLDEEEKDEKEYDVETWAELEKVFTKFLKHMVVFFHVQGQGEKTLFHELDRETRTLNECRINPQDDIMFIYMEPDHKGVHSARIQICKHQSPKHPSCKGTKMLYFLRDEESVQSLRLKIQHQLHIPVEKQILTIHSMTERPSNYKRISSDLFHRIHIEVRGE